MLVTDNGQRGAALAAALARSGVASVRGEQVDGAAAAPTVAHWIVHYRNLSEKFPTITVLADGSRMEPGLIAARAARSDGVITAGVASGPAAQELQRILAQSTSITSSSADEDAARIAAFAKAVRAFGRRGGPPERSAQPRRSPRHVLLTNAGDVRIGLEWGSPQKRGRQVWGGLVKWDAVWMPGADEATTLTTNGSLTFGATDGPLLSVPAGDHTIYTRPGADRFELIISRDTGQFHTVHLPDRELGRIVMERGTPAETVEGLTFAIEPRGSAFALKIAWDDREYVVRIAAGSL